MRRLAAVLLLVFIGLSSRVFATAQEGDILVLRGKQYFIFTNPLELYLDSHPGLLPKTNVWSSALWRGYVATWEIKEGRLLLTDVAMLQSVTKPGESELSTELRSVMQQVFPDQKAVIAEWFTGHIIVPTGKLRKYVHMGYASLYSKYIILRVERGVVIREWMANAKDFIRFREAQFAAFKKTAEYRKVRAEMIAEDAGKPDKMSAAEMEQFLREYYSPKYMAMVFPTPPESKDAK